MARPRDVEKTRDLALRAAAVLEREGLGLPTEQLARHLGVKRPTLLYHLPTYARVVEITLADLLAEQAAFVAAAVDRHDHPIDRIDARVRAIHAFHRGREGRLLFLTQAVAVTGGGQALDIARAAASFFEESRADMVRRVEEGIAAGVVEPCDARALVGLARAVIDGLTIQSVTDGASAEPIHAMFWERVLAPLKRRPTKGGKRR